MRAAPDEAGPQMFYVPRGSVMEAIGTPLCHWHEDEASRHGSSDSEHERRRHGAGEPLQLLPVAPR